MDIHGRGDRGKKRTDVDLLRLETRLELNGLGIVATVVAGTRNDKVVALPRQVSGLFDSYAINAGAAPNCERISIDGIGRRHREVDVVYVGGIDPVIRSGCGRDVKGRGERPFTSKLLNTEFV